MSYQRDVEETGSSERTPMLSGESPPHSSSTNDNNKRSLMHVLHFFGGGIWAPSPSTYDPIKILLNTEDESERDDLTVRWRDNRLSELNFVGIVSALLAGVLTSTGSWPNILPNGKESPWSVRTSWYCGIILSLFSILSAADQTIRKLLAKDGEQTRSAKPGRIRPSMLQIMTWQMPVMFLTTATLCMIVGMFLHVWSATTHLKMPNVWDDNTKVAITFTVIALASVIVFFVGQISLYTSVRGR